MKKHFDIGRCFFLFVTYLILLGLALPILVTILVSFNKGGFALPPSGYTLSWYKKALTYKGFLSGMYVSLIVAIISSLIATLIGTLTSFALVRYRFKGREFVNLLIMSPMMLPVVIMGLSLYIYFVRLGLNDSLYALIIGHAVFIIPFPTRTVTASLQNFDRSLEEAAMNVGAGPLRTTWSITLPVIKTGIIAGIMMSFILSWNNFALSVFLTSPKWIPLPIELFCYIKFDYDPSAAALSSFLIFLSGITIILLDRIIGFGIVMGLQSKKT